MKKYKIALCLLITFLLGMLCGNQLGKYMQNKSIQNQWGKTMRKEEFNGGCGNMITNLFFHEILKEDIDCEVRNTIVNMFLNATLEKKNIDCEEEYKISAREIYMQFLSGERKAYSKQYEDTYVDIDSFIIPTGEPEKKNACWYTLFDCTGDGVPELHVRTAQYYYVFTCMEDKLAIWNSFHPRTILLNNGAFLYDNNGGLAHEDYCYQVLDNQGNIMHQVFFSKYESSGEYEELYFFEEIQVTKVEWKHLTEQYLSIGDDEIEWIDF